MSQEHYFSFNPTSQEQPVERTVTLRGVTYDVVTDSGVFSHDKVDKGTSVLLARVPDPQLKPGDIALDLGCGWGPITLALAHAAPQATVIAVDVNARARELTATNVARAGLNATVCSPEEAFTAADEKHVSLIWSNPPIRIGKAELHALITSWLDMLTDDGVAYLVVQRNLGADSLQQWLLDHGYGCDKVGSAKGYRVFAAYKNLLLHFDDAAHSASNR
ncbi:MAG: class I SAM-dependent methyltransferase [Ancrocorticia sp.]|nr:class I SAM-dependent methyltransferase [Ancrocorticia sp.]MCI1895353.1 class I SAM-dependent methyltransferase [Ancrocorticia sp.]MCI1932040.1 class I SAM-dependent methyltransferase [Ancrocorticia sp.]MCI1963401.1 class I SAM-dependent methyltransferase [Ancrocorticia sp.]MCI2002405.1 class I SAM-dependent methyltransferase [Ancrocorticia sp.]